MWNLVPKARSIQFEEDNYFALGIDARQDDENTLAKQENFIRFLDAPISVPSLYFMIGPLVDLKRMHKFICAWKQQLQSSYGINTCRITQLVLNCVNDPEGQLQKTLISHAFANRRTWGFRTELAGEIRWFWIYSDEILVHDWDAGRGAFFHRKTSLEEIMNSEWDSLASV